MKSTDEPGSTLAVSTPTPKNFPELVIHFAAEPDIPEKNTFSYFIYILYKKY